MWLRGQTYMSKIKDTLIEKQDTGLDRYGPRTLSKRFTIITSEDKNTFKKVLLKEGKETYTVTVFPNFAEYDNLIQGHTVDGYIRIKDSHYISLVDYKKPARSWADNEKFI